MCSVKKTNINHSLTTTDIIRNKKGKFAAFDAADFLFSEEVMALYLHAVLTDGTDLEIAAALQDIGRALIRKYPNAPFAG